MAAAAEQEAAASRLRVSEIFFSIQGEAGCSGWPTVFVRLTGCPLRCGYCDTTYSFHGGEWTNIAAVLADLLDFFSGTYRSRHHGIGGAAVHDPLAVMALTHPQLFTRKNVHVEIETQGTRTLGMTVLDQRDLKEVPNGNCEWQTGLDADAAWNVVLESIAAFS